MAQRPTRRDVRLAQQAQPQQQQMGLETLMPMLAHLYNIQQQQQLQPGVLREQALKEKLAEFNLADAPKAAASKKALEDAQIKHLADDKLPTSFPYLAPDVQNLYLDKAFPERVAQREADAKAKDEVQWPQLIAQSKQSPLSPDLEATLRPHWGDAAVDHLKRLFDPASVPQPQGVLGNAIGTITKVGNALPAVSNTPAFLSHIWDMFVKNANSGDWQGQY